MKTTDQTDGVVGALSVREQDEMMLITAQGIMVRTKVKDIRQTGRNTQGVKLIDLSAKDKLQAIAPVISEDENEADENSGDDAQASLVSQPPSPAPLVPNSLSGTSIDENRFKPDPLERYFWRMSTVRQTDSSLRAAFDLLGTINIP